jgi:hypothetical protein
MFAAEAEAMLDPEFKSSARRPNEMNRDVLRGFAPKFEAFECTCWTKDDSVY